MRAMERFKQGFDLLRTGKDARSAIDLLEEAIKLRPRVPRYHYVAGNAYRSIERYQQAFRHYSMAVELGDKDPLYFAARGVCLRKLRRFSEALEDLSIAIEMDPGEISHWFNRGLVHFEREDLARAEADFSQACEGAAAMSKYAFRSLYNRANCRRRMGLFVLAIEDLRQAISMEPGNAASHDALGLALCDVGDFEAAQRAFERALECIPGHWTFRTHKGLALYHLGRLDEAKLELDEAVRTVERELPSRSRVVDIPATDSEPESTVRLAFPDDAEPYFHRTNVHLAMGLLAAAARDAAVSVASALALVRKDSSARRIAKASEPGAGSSPTNVAAAAAMARAGLGKSSAARSRYGPGGRATTAATGAGGANSWRTAAAGGDRDAEATRGPADEAAEGSGAPSQFTGKETAAVADFLGAARPSSSPARRGLGAGVGEPLEHATRPTDVVAVPLPFLMELREAAGAGAEAAASLTRRLHSSGLVFQAAGAWAAAERCFAAACAVDGGHLAALYHRALMLHVMGWHSEADAALCEVLDKAPDSSELDMPPGSKGGVALDAPMSRPAARRKVLEARGLVRQALGMHERAVEDLEAALDAMEEQQRAAEVAAAERERAKGVVDAAGFAAGASHADAAGKGGAGDSAAAAAGGERQGVAPGSELHEGQLWLSPVPGAVRGECEYHRAVSLLSLSPPDVEAALSGLRRAIESGFATPEAWDKVAASQLLLGRVAAAIRAFSQCIDLAPDQYHFRVRRAQCHREIGDAAAAEDDLSDALELLQPLSAGGDGEAGARQGALVPGPEAAASQAERSLRGVGGVLAIGGVVDTRAAQRSATDAERGRVLFIRALCRYDRDDFPGAMEDCEAALAGPLSPQLRAAAWYTMGIAQANSDDYDSAEASFRESLASDPHPDPEDLVQRLHEHAKALQMLGDHSAAADAFASVIALSPHNAHAFFRRGFSLKALRDYEGAAFAFETAKSLDPDNPALAINYRSAHTIDTVILCAAGEEPSFGPTLVPKKGSAGSHFADNSEVGIRSIPFANSVAVAGARSSVQTREPVKQRAPTAGEAGYRAYGARTRGGVPLQAADLEHSRAGLRGYNPDKP
ncbi:hypothetical protein FNF29_06249 [Cafeteria roenbergensis]|uniref:UDP-N-acetylglucosamine--peptide N-acetylglucosaminyltransferase SPINDLY n=1 Tax=Cafeteria roenbergensis TaxID=33653 RepID=A0A5A8C800_CAFRO|nr:hypothetical protein FNF29_06249 [Cafeteria roenbergensis]|eukprot:KAA0148965.1 hypothetical protein FNF29_06249 [Cafeteria roenbergensis]